MGRPETLNIQKHARQPKRPPYYLSISEVRAKRLEGKLPGFARGYADEDIRVTTVTRLDFYVDECKHLGVEVEEEPIRSNLTIFEDETLAVVKVAYKQNVFSWEEARELGERSDDLYEYAPFVVRSPQKQVGSIISALALPTHTSKTHVLTFL